MVDIITEMSRPPSPTTERLNQREEYDFEEYRKQLFRWLLNHGKDPLKGVGYAEAIIESRGYLIDEFFRWVREQEGTYTTWLAQKHGDDWVDELIGSENGNVYKNNSLRAVQMLFKYNSRAPGDGARQRGRGGARTLALFQ